jgi:hypothetical protein
VDCEQIAVPNLERAQYSLCRSTGPTNYNVTHNCSARQRFCSWLSEKIKRRPNVLAILPQIRQGFSGTRYGEPIHFYFGHVG